jgi:hypothetical protein
MTLTADPDVDVLVVGAGAAGLACAADPQPGYAPDRRALVSTSMLGLADEEQLAAAERRLAELYRTSTRRWERVAAYRIEEALPTMHAPHPRTRTSRVARGRYVCGDHRATGSLQGAPASGARAAREVLQDPAPVRSAPRRAR